MCVCVFCVTVSTGRQTDTVERLAKLCQHNRARTCRDHAHTLELPCWRVWRWFALAPHTHIHTHTHEYACLFVCFSEYTWQLVAELWFAVAPHTIIHTNMRTCVSVYVYFCSVFVCFADYTLHLVALLSVSHRYRWLYLSNNHLSTLPPYIFAGPPSLLWVWVWVFLSTEILRLSVESVDFRSWSDMSWSVLFSVACVYVCSCVTVCTGRQTDTVERSVKYCQHSRTCRDHSHTLQLRWWRVCRWFALAPHTHTFTDTQACMIGMHVWLLAFLSIPCSWLPNSLFLLDTGSLICPTTSFRPCQRTFLPGFSGFRECACFSWLSTEILCLKVKVLIFNNFLTCIGLCF